MVTSQDFVYILKNADEENPVFRYILRSDQEEMTVSSKTDFMILKFIVSFKDYL